MNGKYNHNILATIENYNNNEFPFTSLEFSQSNTLIYGMPSKKNCSEGNIGPFRREGGGKNPIFLLHQKGDIVLWSKHIFEFYGGRGKKFHIFHTHFWVSVSN